MSGDDADRGAARPPAVDWFDPIQLVQTGMRVLVSSAFGVHADARVVGALGGDATARSMDVVKALEEADPFVPPAAGAQVDADEGCVVLDYLADTGDGWDNTFFMAKALDHQVREEDPWPRSRVLVLGGDQVYPAATKAEYRARFLDPFEEAAEELRLQAGDEGIPSRIAVALPGNHDWYDSLHGFSRIFCRGDLRGSGRRVGSWTACQNRSYFALKLPGGWWLLGVDTQFGNDLDRPQLDYFAKIARGFSPGDRLILASAQPEWLHSEWDPEAGHPEYAEVHPRKITNLEFFVRHLARNTPEGARVEIPLYVSGDWHFYARHSASEVGKRPGAKLVIAGGGGAFRYQNHWLVDLPPLRMPTAIASLGTSRARASKDSVSGWPDERDGRLEFQRFDRDTEPAASFPNPPAGFLAHAWEACGNLFLGWKCPRLAMLLGLVYLVFFQVWARASPEILRPPPSKLASMWIERDDGSLVRKLGADRITAEVKEALDIDDLHAFLAQASTETSTAPAAPAAGAEAPPSPVASTATRAAGWGEQAAQAVFNLATATLYDPALFMCVALILGACWQAKPPGPYGYWLLAWHLACHAGMVLALFAVVGAVQEELFAGLQGLEAAEVPASKLFGVGVTQLVSYLLVAVPIVYYEATRRRWSGRKAVVVCVAVGAALGLVELAVAKLGHPVVAEGYNHEQLRFFLALTTRLVAFAASYWLATIAFGLFLVLCYRFDKEYEYLFSGHRRQEYLSFLRMRFDADGRLTVRCLKFDAVDSPGVRAELARSGADPDRPNFPFYQGACGPGATDSFSFPPRPKD